MTSMLRRWVAAVPREVVAAAVVVAVLWAVLLLTRPDDPPDTTAAVPPTPSSTPPPDTAAAPSLPASDSERQQPTAAADTELARPANQARAVATKWVGTWLGHKPGWKNRIMSLSTAQVGDVIVTADVASVPRTTIARARTQVMAATYGVVMVTLSNGDRFRLTVVLEPPWVVAEAAAL